MAWCLIERKFDTAKNLLRWVVKKNKVLAPQVGLEPTTLRLTEVTSHYYHVTLTTTK
jgi:hypothetical protein